MDMMQQPFLKNVSGQGSCLELYLFRHGYTRYNREKRYQGQTDLPLLEEEFERIRPFSFSPGCTEDVVYVSSALRARQTAKLLFPGLKQIVVPEFLEMAFGVFEGRSAEEMESDPQYRSWIDSMCEDPIPGGERRAQFTKRVTDRFDQIAAQTIQEGRNRLLIVAHGGIQMAVMEHLCGQDQPYWSWQSAPGEAVHTLVRLPFNTSGRP